MKVFGEDAVDISLSALPNDPRLFKDVINFETESSLIRLIFRTIRSTLCLDVQPTSSRKVSILSTQSHLETR